MAEVLKLTKRKQLDQVIAVPAGVAAGLVALAAAMWLFPLAVDSPIELEWAYHTRMCRLGFSRLLLRPLRA